MSNKVSLAVLVGLLLGLLVSFAAARLGLAGILGAERNIVRDIVEQPVMEAAAVVKHRDNHFVELKTIESLQSLPNEFDRAEALYALSGRSNSLELQTLAFDALRIADPVWRERALRIVVFRLTEIDPNSALALVHTDYFAGLRTIEAQVWSAWARRDLPAAIDAARRLEDRRFSTAVQMIFSAVGGAYTEKAQLVEAEFGVRPNRSNRRKYLYRLAYESSTDALAHVLALPAAGDRREQIQWLAEILAWDDVGAAEQFAERIDDTGLRRSYLETVFDMLARDDPSDAFERQFAIRAEGAITEEEVKGFKALARSDLDRALRLLDATSDPANRLEIAKAIALDYAKQRPAQALDWARSGFGGPSAALLKTVVSRLAVTDTELVLAEVQQLEHAATRSDLVRSVVRALAKESPSAAAAHLGLIEDRALRTRSAQLLAKEWLKQDAGAAVDWLRNADPEVGNAVFGDRRAANNIDLDQAQAIVLALPEEHRSAWAKTVAERLIKDRSADAALQFVGQFEGQDGYPMQMAHLLSKVAGEDAGLAMQWADRVPPGTSRDAALANIISAEARRRPSGAVDWLAKIDDADLRQVASSELVRHWYKDDPAGTRQWLDGLPRGEERDNVIMNAVAAISPSDAGQLGLIESIDDAGKREQAMLVRSFWELKNDPEALIEKLDAMDMPDMFRQQIKSQVLRNAARGN